MFGSKFRVLALPAVALGALALVGVTAAPAGAETIASGTGTFTVPLSVETALARAGVVVTASGDASASYDNTTKTFTVVYTATGGNADVNNFDGTVDYAGGVKVLNIHNGRTATLSGLEFDVLDDQIVLSANGTANPYLDLAGTQGATINGASQTISASDLTLDAAGADYLNTALGTCAFTAGTDFGSFTTTYSS
ncbi:MAG TPA: hypothetical protein VGN81_09790 [Pseudonocardiaceae bacterium]